MPRDPEAIKRAQKRGRPKIHEDRGEYLADYMRGYRDRKKVETERNMETLKHVFHFFQ